MQRDGWADVPGDAVEGVAYRKAIRVAGFDDQMLFAVRKGGGGGQIQEMDTGVRIFGGDGFVAEVEAEAAIAGFADDAGQNEGGGGEVHVRQFRGVALVPEHGGSGAAFDFWVFGVERKGGGAAGDDARHIASELLQENPYGLEGRFVCALAFLNVGDLKVAVVGVETTSAQTR